MISKLLTKALILYSDISKLMAQFEDEKYILNIYLGRCLQENKGLSLLVFN